MTRIETLGAAHRLPIKRAEDGEKIIRGKNGHLYYDGARLMICYTDDARKAPLTKMRKSHAIRHLDGGLKLTLDCEAEFIGILDPQNVDTAVKILRIRRYRADKGISTPFNSSHTQAKPRAFDAKTDLQTPGGVQHPSVPSERKNGMIEVNLIKQDKKPFIYGNSNRTK